MSAVRSRVAVAIATSAVLALSACGNAGDTATAEPSQDLTGSVWIANEDDDSLSVLDARSGDLITTLVGISQPHNVQATSDEQAVLATSGAGAVVRIDAEHLTVAAVARTGGHPAHVVDDAAGNVYVTSAAHRVIHRYDASLHRRGVVDLVGAPHGLRLDASGRTAVVANTGGGTLDMVDTTTREVTSRVQVGSSPVQVAVTPDGQRGFISVGGTGEVLSIDLATGSVTGRLRMPAAPAQILLVGDQLLVANQGTAEDPGSSLSIVSVDDLTVVGTVPTGSGPHGLTSTPTGDRVWVTNSFDGTVTVVDVASRKAVDTIDVGANPNGITYTPALASPPKLAEWPLLLPHYVAHPEGTDGHSHDGGAHSH